MSQEWSRLVNTTTADYLKGAEPLILRERMMTALAEKKGRIRYNASGTKMDFKVEFKEAPLQGFADGDTVTFSRRDRYQTAELPYRSYIMTDLMSQMERLQNRGTPQIVNLYGEIIEKMIANFGSQFGDQWYVDGNAAGNTKKVHGLESFLAHSTTLADYENATGFAKPSDTYAGLSTIPGNYGGTWTGTWPTGTGEPHYDFWSPVIVNYTAATAGAFSSATATWLARCTEALRKGITKSRKSKSKSGMLDLGLLQDDMFEAWKNANDGKQQINVNRGDPLGLVALGFTDALNFDGVDLGTEFGLPAGTGYGINTMQMEVVSLQDKLFVSVGPVWDEGTQTWRFQLTFYGNLKFFPKFFVKWKNIT
jgi:hypothetical protein